MPPTTAHFNGSVNLRDAETVMREISSRVPSGVQRIPDGETGDRRLWIRYQFEKFRKMPELEDAGGRGKYPAGGGLPRRLRLTERTAAEALSWPNLGYADVYGESFDTFRRLRKDGIIPDGIRFQVQYPTPLASIWAWLVPEHRLRVEPSYERALFADLGRLLTVVPHSEIAVQWDVAVEFGILEGSMQDPAAPTFDGIVERLGRCVAQVPADVPTGVHLCYGDFGHRHAREPESLELQVRVANAVRTIANRPVDWYSFTVPQYQRARSYFAFLQYLRVPDATEIYISLVPYHPARQETGTTDEQIRLVDEYLGGRAWGIGTECGMGRAEPDEIPLLLDTYREILAKERS